MMRMLGDDMRTSLQHLREKVLNNLSGVIAILVLVVALGGCQAAGPSPW